MPAADILITTLKQLHSSLEANLSKRRLAYKEQTNKYRHPHSSQKPVNLVIVEAANFKLNLKSRKISIYHIGPFRVSKQIIKVAYQLGLPEGFEVHWGFHVSQSQKFNSKAYPSLEPVDFKNSNKELYEVESIKASRLSCCKRRYIVKWRNYSI